MLQIDLDENAAWRFSLDVKDANGDPVDMENAECVFIMFDADETEVARASTTGATGTITIGPGPEDDNAYYRLTVTIPYAVHGSLNVTDEYKNVYGNLYKVESGEYFWNGRASFRVFSSASITGATGA